MSTQKSRSKLICLWNLWTPSSYSTSFENCNKPARVIRANTRAQSVALSNFKACIYIFIYIHIFISSGNSRVFGGYGSIWIQRIATCKLRLGIADAVLLARIIHIYNTEEGWERAKHANGVSLCTPIRLTTRCRAIDSIHAHCLLALMMPIRVRTILTVQQTEHKRGMRDRRKDRDELYVHGFTAMYAHDIAAALLCSLNVCH